MISRPHRHRRPYAPAPADAAPPDYHELLVPHAARVKFYREDFTKHDRQALADYSGPFLWACRDSGTNLILLDGEARTNINLDFVQEFYFKPNNYFIHGSAGKVKKITAERARNIWDDYRRNIKVLPRPDRFSLSQIMSHGV